MILIKLNVSFNIFFLLLQTWNPKSKSEPYAQTAEELMNLAKTTMEQFFEIPIGITEDLVQDLADGLESIFQDYMMFVAACGKYSKCIKKLKLFAIKLLD